MLTSIRSLTAAAALAGGLLVATPSFAQEAESPKVEPTSAFTLSGNVAVTTDYRFRGVSLSGGDPAIQGGATLAHDSGFYVGTWASSIQGGALYGEMELDAFGGWAGDLADGLTFDIGLLRYIYPTKDTGPADYWEPYTSLAFNLGPARAKVGAAYAWEQDSLGGSDNLYLYSNLDVGIPSTPLTLSGHLGYTDGVLAPDILAGGTEDTGWDWSLGASATVFGNLSASVAYVGVDGAEVDGLTDDTIVGTLTLAL